MFTAADMALIHFGDRITRFRLQLEKVSCDSFAVLEIVTASTPAPGKTGRLRFAFRCALALGHLAFRACTGDRVRNGGSSECVHKCCFADHPSDRARLPPHNLPLLPSDTGPPTESVSLLAIGL
uniref:Uncharacterized protein n=1 Tax=Anopheles coluzzii TaxID=1518534 RepID=A0A8W7P6Y7_ANOCL